MARNRYTSTTLIQNTVRCTLVNSKKKFQKELDRLGIDSSQYPPFISNSSASATTYFLFSGDDRIAIICMRKGKWTPAQRVSLLAHEVMHVWQDIKKDIGEDSPSEEFEAYAIQGIIQELLEINTWVLKMK